MRRTRGLSSSVLGVFLLWTPGIPKVLDECASPEAARCSGGGYCLDADGKRIAAHASVVDDGGPASQEYALCDGSDAIRLAVVSEGGFVDSTYEFTNRYGHSYLFVDGRCHYYA